MNDYDYIIYTRGFFDNRIGEGRWIALITHNKKVIKTLRNKETNTNEARMKLVAIANSLYTIPDESRILILCDNQFITNAITRNWYKNWKNKGWKTKQGTPVHNRDIWEFLLQKIPRIYLDVRWFQDYEEAPIGKRMEALVAAI